MAKAKKEPGKEPIPRLSYRIIKRTFDIAFSTAVIVIGAIPGAMLSMAVRRDTGGSAIYSQERVGKNGKKFKLYKFRTMVVDADNVEKYLTAEQLETWHREHKVEDDPRITPLGRKLRRTSIDEFPQFINVLLGQMSVIGPRAMTEEEIAHFGSDANAVLSVPAGITGLWQTGPRNEYSFESGKRQQVELEYVRSAGFLLDARIFFKTFSAMANETGK